MKSLIAFFIMLVVIMIVLAAKDVSSSKIEPQLIAVPTYPEVYTLERDLVIKGRIEILGQGAVGKAVFKKGGRAYFK